MKSGLLVVFIVIGTGLSYAQLADSAFDQLLIEKTKAQALVLSVKTAYSPSSSEYKNSKHKYSVARDAFNNYTKAVIENYRLGVQFDIEQSAQTAASRANDFENYVASLDNAKTKGFSSVFLVTGALIDIGARVFAFLDKEQAAKRDRIASAMLHQLTWEDWGEIGAN